MADAYLELLDAAIQHVERLKARGVRYVPVSAQLLEELGRGLPVRAVRQAETVLAQPVHRAAANSFAETPTPRLPQSSTQAGLSPAPTQPSPAISAGTLSPETKAAAFAELRARALACVKCSHLAASRKNVVFGVGNPSAELMFVGEAPGADEDIQGEPFVGKAGQLLTKIIETMGLARDSVYIANILKCRPDMPVGSVGNRKPRPEEMQTCIPFLHEQIDLIKPKVLVALGATAVEGLLGHTVGITKLRGNWRTYRGIPLMPTYHPAYLLRNQALSEKHRVWEDMLQVMEKLNMPISQRQKNFFLKSAG